MRFLWGQPKHLKLLLILYVFGLIFYPALRASRLRPATNESARSGDASLVTPQSHPEPILVSSPPSSVTPTEPILAAKPVGSGTPAEPIATSSPPSSVTLTERTRVSQLTSDWQLEPGTIDRKISPDKETLFDLMMKPLIAEALLRRQQRAASDPGYQLRIDPVLNAGRVNVLVFVSGETHEPPLEWGIIASPSIVSINYISGTVDLVSLTHDIRAPEVSEELGIKGTPQSAQRLDQAILNERVGGFRLARRVLENATGLSIDFQIHAQDTALEKLVDQVFGGVVVDLPIRMELGPYYMKKRKYDEDGRVFPEGKLRLNGRESVGFIKAIPSVGPKDKSYSPLMEHNMRKAMVFRALQEALKSRFSAQLLFSASNYAVNVVSSKDVTYDFDHTDLVAKNLGQVIPIAARLVVGKSEMTQVPPLGKQLYIVDRCCSTDPENMPVHWANWIGPGEDNIRKDWQNKVFRTDIAYQVPYGANPYGDLITGYWHVVRAYVRKALVTK